MTEAWKADMPPGRKFVLLSLCDNANDQGECFPSVSMIAKRCSMGERTVQGHIHELEKSGILQRNERAGRSTIYLLNPRRFSAGVVESHYTYCIEDTESGEFYIGVRTCRGDANRDGYMGSGSWFNERVSNGRALKKTVLGVFQDRQGAEADERNRIANLIDSPLCMNKRTPADSAPRNNCAPQELHPTPADSAPTPPQISHPTPAVLAPITINEPSVEPKNKKAAPSFELPEWVNRVHWDAWHSCAKRKKASDAQKQMAVEKLTAWRNKGEDFAGALENAAVGGYQGLFLPNQQGGAKGQQAETTYQRTMRERMQEAAPEAARKDPAHAAHAADFFNAIEVPTRTVERIR